MPNTILDCQIGAAIQLNDDAVSAGSVAEVGGALCSGRNPWDPDDPGGAVTDVGPASGEQLLTGPNTDAGGASGCDDAGKTWIGIEVSRKTASSELGTDDKTHAIIATITAGPGSGVGDVSVAFEVVSGPNAPASGSDSTDSAGQATFTYTGLHGLAGRGTDVIWVRFTDPAGVELCETADKHWVDTPPEGACAEGTDPHGKSKPRAKNEDGFYELLAEDAVDPDPDTYVKDPVSGRYGVPLAAAPRSTIPRLRVPHPARRRPAVTRARLAPSHGTSPATEVRASMPSTPLAISQRATSACWCHPRPNRMTQIILSWVERSAPPRTPHTGTQQRQVQHAVALGHPFARTRPVNRATSIT